MGCFWKPQDLFSGSKGVKKTETGYMGGDESYDSLTYEEVCSGKTGHAEVVKIEYDNEKINYDDLLEIFWKNHNPTQLNRQGPDFGSQYRSIIFYSNKEQKKKAEKSLKEEQKEYTGKIVTEIRPIGRFYRAEEYHQDFVKKHGKSFC